MTSEHSDVINEELDDSSGSILSDPSSYDEFPTFPLFNPTTDSQPTSPSSISESPLAISDITQVIMSETIVNDPIAPVPPNRGGIHRAADEVIPWTGGDPRKGDRKVFSLSCLRPLKLKDIGPIRAEASKGLETGRRLGLPGASGSSITFSVWMRYVDRHLQLCGMDGVFYVPKKDTPELLHYVATDWGHITMDDVDEFLNSDELDDYDRQNLQWSGQFLQDSVSLEMWGCIEPEVGASVNGLKILVAIIYQYQSSASATIRNLTNQLTELSLIATPGENVEQLCGTIHELASQIEGLGEAPRDLATLVAGRFLKSSTQAFSSEAMAIYKRTSQSGRSISWQTAIRELKTAYTTLRNEGAWDAITPPKSSTESALAAIQQELAELKRKGSEPNFNGGSNSAGSSDKTVKKPNIFKTTPAPKEGESNHKIIEGKDCTWCGICKRWIYGPRRHSTEEHKTRAELNAAKAPSDGEKASVAAEGSTKPDERSGTSTLSMSSGFWAGANSTCKFASDF